MPSKLTLDRSILGGTGLNHTGFITEEQIPELNGLSAVRKYREMSENDPVLFAILYAITMLLRGVEWRVEPVESTNDNPVDEDDAKEAASFTHGVLFEDMSHPWEDFIAQVISFLTYGHALHEIVWKIRGGQDTTDPAKFSKFDDGLIGIRKLAPRPQDTIWRWIFQEDMGLAGVYQVLPDRPSVTIPIDKLLLFRTETVKNNPEGRSILRGCYVPYTRKQAIEAAEGRAAMRSAGIVKLEIPAVFLAPDADANQKIVATAFKQAADRIAQDRQGSIVLPSDRDEKGNALFNITYVVADSRRSTDMGAIVERYDKRMAASVLADFILLGQQSVGSFALSSDKTQLFARSLMAYLDMIAAPINRVLLPRLWQLNKFDPKLMPTVKPGDVSARDLAELGQFVQQITSAGARMFPDTKLENVLRDAANLPPLDDAVLEEQEAHAQSQIEQQAQMTAATQPPDDGGNGGQSDNTPPGRGK